MRYLHLALALMLLVHHVSAAVKECGPDKSIGDLSKKTCDDAGKFCCESKRSGAFECFKRACKGDTENAHPNYNHGASGGGGGGGGGKLKECGPDKNSGSLDKKTCDDAGKSCCESKRSGAFECFKRACKLDTENAHANFDHGGSGVAGPSHACGNEKNQGDLSIKSCDEEDDQCCEVKATHAFQCVARACNGDTETAHADFNHVIPPPRNPTRECGPHKSIGDLSKKTCDDENKRCCEGKVSGAFECFPRECRATEKAHKKYNYVDSPIKCSRASKCQGENVCCADNALAPTKSRCRHYPSAYNTSPCSGEFNQVHCDGTGGSPCREPTYAHNKIRPVVAGASMGAGHDNGLHYWTLGFVVCDPSTNDRYGVTNFHNVAAAFPPDPHDTVPQKDIFQPSKNHNDNQGQSEKVASYADWKYYEGDGAWDAALIKFDRPELAAAKVLTPTGTLDVLGIMSSSDLTKLNTAEPKPSMFLAGRTSGWMELKFVSYDSGSHRITLNTDGPFVGESFNPNSIGMSGNSGSGLFYKDPDHKGGVFVAALFDGSTRFMAAYHLVDKIKTDKGLKNLVGDAVRCNRAAVHESIKSKGDDIKKILSPPKKQG